MKVLRLRESHFPGAVLEIEKGVFLSFFLGGWGRPRQTPSTVGSQCALLAGLYWPEVTRAGPPPPRPGRSHYEECYATTSAQSRGILERQTTYWRLLRYKKLSRQDLLNPGPGGDDNLLEDIPLFVKFQGKEKSFLQLC